MSTDLKVFDKLVADITAYVSPVLGLVVSDAKTCDEAIEAGKLIRGYRLMIDKKRKELVAPLQAQIDAINDYTMRGIDVPLEVGQKRLANQISVFNDKLLAEKKAAQKLEDERREKEERAAQEAAEKAREELAAKHRAQLAQIEPSEADNPLGSDDEADLVAEQAREQAEADAVLRREAAQREAEAKQRAYDLDQNKVKNVAKNWDAELVDIEQVPAHFVIKTLNKAACVAAARGGTTNIPGVRLFQKSNVRFGANTSVGGVARG